MVILNTLIYLWKKIQIIHTQSQSSPNCLRFFLDDFTCNGVCISGWGCALGCPISRSLETMSLLPGFDRMLQELLPGEKARILQNTDVLQLTIDVCVYRIESRVC